MLRLASTAMCFSLLAAIVVLGAVAPPAEAQLAISKEHKYTGTGSCAASSCHGAKKPAAKPGDPDDTYTIWAAKDKHNKAYTTLTNKKSADIVAKMKLPKATETEKCTGCHALKLSKDQLTARAKYDIADGVSCDSCHGPAEKWLEGHDKGEKAWPHAKSVGVGMYDTKDVLKRAELCVSCHLAIEAEMITAGHPSMIFELDSFSASQPPHWKDQKEWFGPLAWGTGQAVALEESAGQLATRLKADAPDALTKESYDQTRGHAIALRPYLAQVAADQGKALDTQLAALVESYGKDKAKAGTAAAAISKLGDEISKKVAQAKLNKDIVLATLKGQVANEQATAGGLRSAEQVAMSVDSLFRSYNATAKPAEGKAVDAAIGKMFDDLPSKPADFNAQKFTTNLGNVAKAIK
jgi:Cytochrome c554 and c-prime